jgi:hypothetical protein
MSSTAPSVGPGAELAALYASGHTPRHVVRHDDRPAVRHEDEHDEHPVAAVLALKPRTASAEPALLPRPATGPGHLTSR